MAKIKRTPLSPATATQPPGILRIYLDEIKALLTELKTAGTGGAMQPHDFWGMHTIDGAVATLSLLKEKLNLTWDTIAGRPSVFPAAPHSLWGSAHKELGYEGTLSEAVTPETLIYKLIEALNSTTDANLGTALNQALGIHQPEDPLISSFCGIDNWPISNWPGATLSNLSVNFNEPLLSVKGIIHSHGNNPTGTVQMSFPLEHSVVPDLFDSLIVPKQIIGLGIMTSGLNTSTASGIPCFVVARGTSSLNSDRCIQFRYSTSPSSAQDVNSGNTPIANFWTQNNATLSFYFQCPAYRGM